MVHRDRYGLTLATGADAAAAYSRGLDDLLHLRAGAAGTLATSIVLDPTFALGHADLALLGHDLCVEVDVVGRMRDAERWAHRGSEREQSHVAAVLAHLRGDSRPVLDHLVRYPVDALLLAAVVPSIAFAGAAGPAGTAARAREAVESVAPAYGRDGWYAGLLAVVRQQQGRHGEAVALAARSLDEQPDAGLAAYALAHAHQETGAHVAGLAWVEAWIVGAGARCASPSHYSWHAALHELALGDTAAVGRRYESQLRPGRVSGCRALVDTGSLLVRWSLLPDARDVPDLGRLVDVVDPEVLARPATPFLGLHAAAVLHALGDADALATLATWASAHGRAAHREVVAPLAHGLRLLLTGRRGSGLDVLDALDVERLGGSRSQRDLVAVLRRSVDLVGA